MSIDTRCRRAIRENLLQKPHLTHTVAKDKAAECLELAAAAGHVAHRLIIENMAKTWERIAEVLEDEVLEAKVLKDDARPPP
jgi:hypothetical protein